MIINDGDVGYTASGQFTQSLGGFSGSCQHAPAGQSTASWVFKGLEAGESYVVSITWVPRDTLATNAQFTIEGGSFPVVVNVDQKEMPIGEADCGCPFQSLGDPVEVVGDTITVTLDANDANGYVVADAVSVLKI